ncbi:MAG TPA: pantothenate kinase [Bacteroidales bacterium]|nr:MAG: hypothetical protein A2X11_01275 [Bacteroidetes bacterium GWE2_42_24]OFY27329.1 MAG: hypothetical protein A2X09_00485 [Bacteroidetes bacterium GWF2_43_11]PKP25396.1 MAG: pantothenate kinase [Bacteroidetes bacterium HGW-Bacteroidetes-22]HAQ65049.1 pantothenate kinase [Bacteroidales bacterium]HBZ65925.1 pantothenate kinase [Bacteroidales bacterium]
MNLVIDIGNTRVKLALFEKEIMVAFAQNEELTIGWLEDFINTYVNGTSSFTTIISSVAEEPDSIVKWLETQGKVIHLSQNIKVPLDIQYKSPETLGSDRLAGAVAAWNHYGPGNILVFQAGSCLTHEFLSKEGGFMGGAISPGMGMRFKSLHTFTSRLPLISHQEIRLLTGRTTEESILSGVINGMAAEIDGTINCYRDKYVELKVILTGGDLNYFDKRLKNSIFAHPNLVLDGLNLILRFNESIP